MRTMESFFKKANKRSSPKLWRWFCSMLNFTSIVLNRMSIKDSHLPCKLLAGAISEIILRLREKLRIWAVPRVPPLPLPSWTGMLSDFIILCCWTWCWWCWWWWCWGGSTALLPGTVWGGQPPPPAGAPAAPPEAMAGAMSFRPKFSKLLETLLMLSGAALALALEKEEERSSHPCQRLGTGTATHAFFSENGRKKIARFEHYREGALAQL